VAFKKAFAHCDTMPTGCTLELPPTAPGVPSIYRSSAINLTSRLDLVIPENVTLRATENDEDNWGDGWPTLLHSSAPSPCAGTPGNCGCGPAKQSWIHAYNVTDVSVGGGGTIHVRPDFLLTYANTHLQSKSFTSLRVYVQGGGRYWWCVRENLAHGHRPWQPAMQIHGCATARALPNVTRGTELLTTCPPRMWHVVESRNLRIYDLQVQWAGYWTLHFQFSDQILVEGVHIWNPSNQSFNGPNGDGIDIDSSTNALVRDSIIDAADDALCIKSGADWLGRHVNRPTANVLFTNIEVRNGHGLTLGSDCSGGASNITWRSIFMNGQGPTCTVNGVHTCGNGPGRGAGPGGPHWKTGRSWARWDVAGHYVGRHLRRCEENTALLEADSTPLDCTPPSLTTIPNPDCMA
jgi:polygalacturonase